MTHDESDRLGENPQVGEKADKEQVWRSVRPPALPPFVTIIAVLVVAAFVWGVAEAVWPRSEAGALEIAGDTSEPGASQAGAADSSQVVFSQSVFSARKLFIPEVPVESQETSRAVVEEMLARLRLTGVTEENGEFIAWVLISASSPDRGGSRRGSASASVDTSSRTERMKKGDHVLDFTVEDVKQDSVQLSVAGFEVALSF